MAKTDPKKQGILDKAISFFYCERNKDIENFIKNGSRGYDSTAVIVYLIAQLAKNDLDRSEIKGEEIIADQLIYKKSEENCLVF
jgi:hypothetical protein